MRRFLTAAFLAFFVAQTSGAAIARPSLTVHPQALAAQIHFEFAQLLSSFQSTRIGALITGKESQYEAMHAPPPDFSSARAIVKSPTPDLHLPVRTPAFRSGVFIDTPDMRDRRIHPNQMQPDPLAMKSAGQSHERDQAVRRLPLMQHAPVQAVSPTRHSTTIGSTAGSGVTGINPWWTYEEGAAPGVGKWMVNAATGNLMFQEHDVDIPERGIDLAFQATYNSMSMHDSAGSDGSTPSNYGNGWTNTFDAHISYNAATNVMTVWDVDGARYDYTSDGAGHWIAPAGQHAVLAWDGGCGYSWSKKTGTIYGFYSPSYNMCAGTNTAGFNGRLYIIQARNHNNYLTFNYSWDTDASTAAHLRQIDVVHSDGHDLLLTFADFPNNGSPAYRELASVTRPDGTQITYQYDNSGNLTGVFEPVNNSNYGYHQFQYWSPQTHQLMTVVSPVYAQNGANKGGYVAFWEDGSNRATNVRLYGWGNFVPSDNTGAPLQQGPAQAVVVLSSTAFSYPTSGETDLSDADGHATDWLYDGQGRVVETKEWTGLPNNLWLTTSAIWDNTNNLTETTDARGNVTDVGYDGNGNTLWVQGPPVQTSLGEGRPVARYSYDQFNNLTSYCDPQYVWTSGVTTCSPTSGTHYAYSYTDSNEPHGCLTDTYKPLGYHARISYGGTTTCGSYGLPTQVLGDAVSQATDTLTPSRTPTQTFAYDTYGNLTSYSNGVGTATLTYDTSTTKLNRVLTVTDPDGYTSYKYYYPNGQISKTETAYQHATATGPTFSYDADGNLTQANSYHAGSYNSAGALPTLPTAATPTIKYYDGADRLVEVQQERDPSGTAEAYTNAWITRYIYDLSQGQTVAGATPTIGGQTVQAYGNLFKTEELVPPSDTVTFSNTALAASNTSFHELKGNAFDALDRTITRYFYVLQNGTDTLQHETYTYDAQNPLSTNSNFGELSSETNGINQVTNFAYGTDGKVLQTQHTASPALDRQFTYDPDGRTTAVTVPGFGSQTYAYDSDGRLAQSAEPTSMESAATLTYEYYLDGMRKALDVSSALLNQRGLFTYGYRNDGKLETQQINQPGNALVGTTTLTFSYSNAGRLKQRAESGPGGNSTPTQIQYNATYGILSEVDYPGGNKEQNVQFDPSGAALGQTSNWSTANPSTYSLTVRGELRTSAGPVSTNQPPPSVNIMANGVAVNTRYQVSKTLTTTSWNATIDPRMGVVLGTSATDSGGNEVDTSVTFDALGRATQDSNDSAPGPSCDTCQGKSDSVTRSYDQENHVTATNLQECSSSPCTSAPYANFTYDWGAESHPLRIGASYKGSATAYETLHWDGDTLLFTTHAGVLDDIKIGEIGDITPQDTSYKGLTFWDRDVSSNVVYCHNATGAAGNGTAAFPYSTGYRNASVEYTHNPCTVYSGETMTVPHNMFWGSVASTMASGSPPMIGSGGVLTMPRGDGFNDGINVVQGVRIYDSTLGGWSTPDAYEGDVSDPMSQKNYIWNRSNAVSYTDPSGFLSLQQREQLEWFVYRYPPKLTPMDCTTYIEAVYKQSLGIDIPKLVAGDYYNGFALFHGYNLVGANPLGKRDPAASAENLHNYFSRQNLVRPVMSLTGAGLQVGDIIFMIEADGHIHHIAMVSQVQDGHATQVIESTGKGPGQGTTQKSYTQFVSDAANEGMAQLDYARLPAVTISWSDIISMLDDQMSEGSMQNYGGIEIIGPVNRPAL